MPISVGVSKQVKSLTMGYYEEEEEEEALEDDEIVGDEDIF